MNIQFDLRSQGKHDTRDHSMQYIITVEESLLNPVHENAVREKISFINLVSSITRSNETVEDDIGTRRDPDAAMYSVKEQFHAPAVAKSVFDRQKVLSRETKGLFMDSQRALRLERQKNLCQATISDWFK